MRRIQRKQIHRSHGSRICYLYSITSPSVADQDHRIAVVLASCLALEREATVSDSESWGRPGGGACCCDGEQVAAANGQLSGLGLHGGERKIEELPGVSTSTMPPPKMMPTGDPYPLHHNHENKVTKIENFVAKEESFRSKNPKPYKISFFYQMLSNLKEPTHCHNSHNIPYTSKKNPIRT
ncbi:hypothetical protein COCNU_scaffold001113G000010 [Cocos nucifera]|nr:hypothetical protein [Cocos nucifera]